MTKEELEKYIGHQVVYTKDLQALTFEYDKNYQPIKISPVAQGFLSYVSDTFCTIVYPANIGHELVNGGWELIKKKPFRVYAHSAKFNEIELLTPSPYVE